MRGGKNVSFVVMLAAVIMTLMGSSAFAQLVGTVKDVETSVGSSGKIDWTTGVITAVRTGTCLRR
jgi:hypothetical protein